MNRPPPWADPRDGRSRRIWAASIAVSVAALALVSMVVDWSLVRSHLTGVRVPFLLAAVLSFLCLLLTRALRLRRMLSDELGALPLDACLRVTSLHQLAFALLPSGLGDVTFPALVRRFLGGSLSRSAPALVLMRTQDLVVLTVFAVTGFGGAVVASGIGVPAMLGAAALGGLLLYGSDRFIHALVVALHWVLRQLHWSAEIRLQRLVRSIETARAWVTSLGEPSLRLSLSFWCATSWCLSTLTLWLLFQAYCAPVSLPEALFLIAGLNVVGAIAIVSVGKLGVSELGLASLLVLLGADFEEAGALALSVRPSALLIAILVPLLVESGFRLSGRGDASRRRSEIEESRRES